MEYYFSAEDAYYLLSEEEINYVEPDSTSDSDSDYSDVSSCDNDSTNVSSKNKEDMVGVAEDENACVNGNLLNADNEDQLWISFMEEFYSGEITFTFGDDDEEDDADFECDYSSSDDSSEDEDSSTSESGDAGIPGTFPYMNSDSEAEVEDKDVGAYADWCRSIKAFDPQIEVITVDDDEDVIIGEMRCLQCPDGLSVYRDKGLFLLHRERHKGRNHFVCPTCLKPFIKISYCFAHEVRIHGMEFALQNPLITDAVLYRHNKQAEREREKLIQEEEKKLNEIKEKVEESEDDDPDFFDNAEPAPPKKTKESDVIKTPFCANFAGLILFPEEGIYETDEEDPKFTPDNVVPSTALYPYRGLEPLSMYDCYEIHLRYGRKKKTAANTIARCAMARRRRLIEEGKIAEDDIGRFWKPPKVQPLQQRAGRGRRPPKRKRKGEGQGQSWETSSSSTTAGRKRKGRSSSCEEYETFSTDIKEVQRRKRRKVAKKIPPPDIIDRTFIAGIISRTCLICGFSWATELELKAHRDEKHPKKTVVELMTKVKKRKNRSSTSPAGSKLHEEIVPLRKKRKVEQGIPIPAPTEKECFMVSLGLVTNDQCAFLKSLKPPIRGKLCYVKMVELPIEIETNGRAYVCQNNGCNYYSTTKDLLAQHVRFKHFNNSQQSATSRPFSFRSNPRTVSRNEQDRIRLQELADLINKKNNRR